MMIEADKMLEAINGPEGYWAGQILSSDECAELKAIVFDHFLERIERLAPQHVDAFASVGLENYHTESWRIDHGSSWPQCERLFNSEGVSFILRSSLFQHLNAVFGSAEITNETRGGQPEVTWRLVRPGELSDIGPLHADEWFWRANGWTPPNGKRRIKIWTMVSCAPDDTALRVVPGSHCIAWEFGIEPRHGILKPVFDEAKAGVAPIALCTPPGTSVIFSYDLLHGGKPPSGNGCRISLEFTILCPGIE